MIRIILSFPFIFLGAVISSYTYAQKSQQYGDRSPAVRQFYPEDAFYHFGGRIIDVTKPPFNAKGDGKADDTEALIAAYDVIADAMRSPFWSENRSSFIIYLPNGTYQVSNTIIHNPPRIDYGKGWGGVSRVRFIGESREKTIIKLKDYCEGYQDGSEKRVLSYQYEPGTNVPAENLLANLTINTGKGNPGAVGVMFHGANLSGISNLKIVSEDGTGAVGLDFGLFSMQGQCKDINIAGFDYGIRVVPYAECNPTLEYITLKNQRKSGILVQDGSPSIRQLWSQNEVPAITIAKTESPAAQVVLVESLLEKGNVDNPAIKMETDKSQLFIRNIKIADYSNSFQLQSQVKKTGNIEEYFSGSKITLFDNAKSEGSLKLRVKDIPQVKEHQDLKNWANVDKMPGDSDREKVQAAMNSGKPIVYFPGIEYDCGEITVPPSVERIEFLYSRPNIKLNIHEPSDRPLLVQQFTGRGEIQIKAPRTLIMSNTRFLSYQIQHDQPNEIFLESSVDIGSHPSMCGANVKVWARSINNENKGTPNFKVYGGKMWVLGYKTEGHQPSFEVTNGGICEVLGGYRNETTPDEGLPILINKNSTVSFVGYSSMARVYEQVILETQNGITRTVNINEVPVRAKNDVFIPLYVGLEEIRTK